MPRRLGQHFLRDQKALRKIVAALEITPHDTIVEVGPGHGELTQHILNAKPKKIIAIERDPQLANFLKENFQFTILSSQSSTKSRLPKRGIVEGDALKVLPDFIWKLKNENWKLVGNIPYYITGHLLRKISELEKKPKLVVLTIQKEVAERIAAEPLRRRQGSGGQGNMNLLAASVQFWGEPKILGYISKKSFRPPPKVDSAIIKISPNSKQPSQKEAERYYQFIKILFKQPRKTILNNLREGLTLPQKEIEKRLQKLNISPGLRPANLSMPDINKLTLIFRDKKV